MLVRHYKSAYSGLPVHVWLLCLVTFANRLGTMVIPFMALYLTKEMSLPVTTVGHILCLFGAGALCGGYFGGWLSTKFPPTRVQALTLTFEASTLIAFTQMQSLWPITIGLFLLGFFSQAFRPANATAVVNACPPDSRARALALNRLAINLGMSAGPALGGVLASYHYQWLFYVDAGTCLAAMVLVLLFFYRNEPKEKNEPHHSDAAPTSCFVDKPFIAVMALFALGLIIFFQLEHTFLVYLREQYAIKESRLGLLYTINSVLVIGFEMILIHKVERLDKLLMTGVGCSLICLGFSILPFGKSFLVAGIAMAILTFGEMLALPLSGAWAADRSHSKNRGLYMGVHSATFGLAITGAPFVGMQLYAYHPNAPWYLAQIMGVVLLAAFWWLSRCHLTTPDLTP